MLNIIDEFTRECLAIRVNRKLNSTDVIDILSDLFIMRGVPGHVRSDNGPESGVSGKVVRHAIFPLTKRCSSRLSTTDTSRF